MAFTFFMGSTTSIVPAGANAIGVNDYGTGTGADQDFTLTNNQFDDLGNLAQAGDATFYSKLLGTLTSSGPTNAHTSTAPDLGAGIIFPNANCGSLRAYDDPLYTQTAFKYFAVGDVVDIDDNQYIEPPAGPGGIKVYFTNRITEITIVEPTWFSFAPLNAADMSIGAYSTPGDPLYLTDDLIGGSTLSVGKAVGQTSITLVDATGFAAGQFVAIGTGGTMDVCWVTQIISNTLTLLQPLAYNHSAGETVYACAAGFACKVDIPTGAGGGSPQDWFNCSLDCDYQTLVRV
jgi:hypothetical protein